MAEYTREQIEAARAYLAKKREARAKVLRDLTQPLHATVKQWAQEDAEVEVVLLAALDALEREQEEARDCEQIAEDMELEHDTVAKARMVVKFGMIQRLLSLTPRDHLRLAGVTEEAFEALRDLYHGTEASEGQMAYVLRPVLRDLAPVLKEG